MLRKCTRCNQDFELPSKDKKTNVCGNCADELRAEEDAHIAQSTSEAGVEAMARYEAEEAERIARDHY